MDFCLDAMSCDEYFFGNRSDDECKLCETIIIKCEFPSAVGYITDGFCLLV